MKPEETIKVLTDKNTHIGTLKCLDDTWRKLQTAIDEAVEALGKQIPKKPIKIKPCKTISYYKCPFCKSFLAVGRDFCAECGQAIDWTG